MNSAQQIWPIFRNVYPKALLNVIINKLISAPDVSMACLFLSSDDIQEMSERSERICGFFFSMKMLATSCFWRLVFNFYGYYSFYLSSLKIHTRRKMSNDFFNHHIPHTHTHTSDTERQRHAHTQTHKIRANFNSMGCHMIHPSNIQMKISKHVVTMSHTFAVRIRGIFLASSKPL